MKLNIFYKEESSFASLLKISLYHLLLSQNRFLQLSAEDLDYRFASNMFSTQGQNLRKYKIYLFNLINNCQQIDMEYLITHDSEIDNINLNELSL